MPGDFDWDRVPTHLRLHFEILDATGQVIAAGDDLGAVREQLLVERAATVAAMAHPIERSGIIEWDFGVLPATVPLGDPDTGAGVAAVGRPALIDEGDSVAIRLVANTDEQVDQTWRGVRRLLVLALPSASRLLDSVLSGQGSLALAASPYAGRAEWAADALTCALDKIMSDYGPLPLAAAEFQALLAATKNDLADVLDDVADVSERILVALSHLGVVYERTTGARYADATKDVADQISQFVYPGFLTGVGYDRLGDVLRYVEAATYRLEKLPDAFERDAAAMTRVRRLEADFEEIVDSIPWRSEILDVTWMLQELRVSLFAQPIGAKGKVSEKRVRQALAELVLPS